MYGGTPSRERIVRAVSGLVSGLVVRAVDRLGVRTLLAGGMLALAIGSLLLGGIAPGGNYFTAVLPGLILVAAGMGVGYTLGTLAATAGVEAQQQGVASGILNTSMQLGGAVGLAALAALASGVSRASTGPASQALTEGFRAAFLVMALLGLTAAITVWALVRVRKDTAASSPHPILLPDANNCPCQPTLTGRASRLSAKT